MRKVPPANRRGKGSYIYFSPETDARVRKVAGARLVPVTRLVEFAVERLLDALERGEMPSLGLGVAGGRELGAADATHDDEAVELESLPLPFVAPSSSSVSTSAPSSRPPAASKITRRHRREADSNKQR